MKDETKTGSVSSSLSTRERRTVWLLAAVGFLSRVALMFRSDWKIASRPYIEDAFYSLSCARQLALGHGFSVDGIHPTNGVQPLICLVNAPCFLVTSDRWLGVRLTFIVAGLIQFLSVLVLSRLLSQFRELQAPSFDGDMWLSSPVLGALLWVTLAPLLVHNMNGLETGLYALLILCSFSYYQSVREWSSARIVLFGVLLGLVVLARIDGIVLVASFACFELYRSRGKSLIAVLAFGFIAVVVSSPWWIYNQAVFGSLMPISGQSETLGLPIAQNLLQSAAAIFDILTVFFYHNYYHWSVELTVGSFLVLLSVWVFAMRREKDSLKERAGLIPLALFSIGILLYYNFLFSAPHFISQYLHPLRILTVILFSLLAPKFLGRYRTLLSNRFGKKLSVCLAAAVLLIFSIWVYVSNFARPANSDLYQIGLWAEKQSGRVGMGQSGTAGFIAGNVVNLDGKVNPDALRARRAGRIGEYIARERIEYLADWNLVVSPLVAAAHQYGAEYVLVDSIRYIMIYKRVEAVEKP